MDRDKAERVTANALRYLSKATKTQIGAKVDSKALLALNKKVMKLYQKLKAVKPADPRRRLHYARHGSGEDSSALEKEMYPAALKQFKDTYKIGKAMADIQIKMAKLIDKNDVPQKVRQTYSELEDKFKRQSDFVKPKPLARKGYEASDAIYSAGMVESHAVSPLYLLHEIMREILPDFY